MKIRRFTILFLAGVLALVCSACQKKPKPMDPSSESPENEASVTEAEEESTEPSLQAEEQTDPPSSPAPSTTHEPTEPTPLFETPSAPPIQTIYVPPRDETAPPQTRPSQSAQNPAPTLPGQTDPPEVPETPERAPETTKAPRGPYTGGNPLPAPASLPAIDLRADPTAGGYPAYIRFNGNKPLFSTADIILCEDLIREYSDDSFEFYSPLDGLGRCGYAFAIVGPETMPNEPRGSIASIRPSGWHTVRYDDLIYDKYLYNRCHLISYSLSGENANARNLITGTRYMNVTGMLDFENEAVYYIRRTGNHVMYRATPVFHGNDLVAYGVLLEAYSLEDRGTGVSYCVFCPNVQPGIVIDYATGDSRRAEN